jgi:NADPH-dependent glutamate synthase beta subunit-like oxidoreductase
MSAESHAVAVIGGAVAGAEIARTLADRGAWVAVFEQNRRPYGKIEGGLPRWHTALRSAEYEKIQDKLTHPNISYVPCTKVGTDVDFGELAQTWGFSAVVLACGAWRDRPLPVDGADDFLDRGFHYQNPFIVEFNRREDPLPAAVDRGLVIGGGLASIDVVKVLMLETTRKALAERGIEVDLEQMEKSGIPKTLESHGLAWEDLGLEGATLVYRREAEDMPLLEMPAGADEARREKVGRTRRRALEKAMSKFLFRFEPLCRPLQILDTDGKVSGVRFERLKKAEGRKLVGTGDQFELPAAVVISSIGSIPEPIPGITMQGELLAFQGEVLPRLEGFSNVFSAGNAVTGKGNIIASRRHASGVAGELLETFLGLREGHEGEEVLADTIEEDVQQEARGIQEAITQLDRPDGIALAKAKARVKQRQAEVGYDGDLRAWVAAEGPA